MSAGPMGFPESPLRANTHVQRIERILGSSRHAVKTAAAWAGRERPRSGSGPGPGLGIARLIRRRRRQLLRNAFAVRPRLPMTDR